MVFGEFGSNEAGHGGLAGKERQHAPERFEDGTGGTGGG